MPPRYRLDHAPGTNKVEAHPASMTKKVGKPKSRVDTLGRGQESLVFVALIVSGFFPNQRLLCTYPNLERNLTILRVRSLKREGV